MSTRSIEVEIVEGKVIPVSPHVLPATGRGVLMVIDEIDRGPFPPVEIVEGPDGYLIARGGRRITAEMVQAIQDRIDIEDAIRHLGPFRNAAGELQTITSARASGDV